MELYLEVLDNSIINVFTEQIDENLITISVDGIDNLYDQIKEYKVDSDIEERFNDILEKQDDVETLNTFNIKHWVSNRSFGELIDMYDSGEIIKPEMQREFVWDSLKCSRLIESIIIGLPIPPLFLLEIGKNKYEIIDGFQRLTTLYNFVEGNPWHGKIGKRNVTAKLSKKLTDDLAGKSFEDLDDDYQRIVKRSTIPLIEFKQLEPDNLNSKYLIFERINTGSEKLNSMQIRKSLAYGNFMESLYKNANTSTDFLKFFSSNNIKKDQHVEAYLRIMVMSDIYYRNFKPEKYGIKNILNEYCEKYRENEITEDYINRFDKSLNLIYKIFKDSKSAFKRVEKKEDKFIFPGNLNVSIMEAFIGVLINNISSLKIDTNEIFNNYCTIMNNTLNSSLRKLEDNPFTTSTGILEMINKRFQLCSDILEL